jgi:hypothetical protein
MSQVIRERSAPLQQFTGGLNNYWDQSAIADDELSSVVNLEFTVTGSLASRPPIFYETDTDDEIVTTPAESEPLDTIGSYVRQDGERFIVAVTDDKTWVYNVRTKVWTEIADFRASDSTQYLNKIVLCSETQAGGYWEDDVFTETPTMPYLSGIELFQTRFFGFGVQGTTTANILYWSNISTAGPSGESTSVWDWEDDFDAKLYVEIGGGDGQWITALEQGYNDIVIFRNRSTYRFSYGELPQEGTIQGMQQDIGAETRRCVAKFDNAHFVLSGGILYKYQNWIYYPMNVQKVRFEGNPEVEHRFERAISIIGRRCYVWFKGSVYVFNLDTETWSQWQSSRNVGYFQKIHRQHEDPAQDLFFGISGSTDFNEGETDYSLYRIQPGPDGYGNQETMECTLRTKIYDFNTPVEWKRLYFWAVDVVTALPFRAVARPVSIREKTSNFTWDQLDKLYEPGAEPYTWDEFSFDDPSDPEFGSWDALITPSGAAGTTVDDFVAEGRPIRMEAKLNEALRFRRIYFELYLDCDGTAATSPVQVFSIIPMVGAKAKVSKEAN